MGQQAREKLGGAIGKLTGGNQTGNQSGGVAGLLGDQAKSMLSRSTNGTLGANQTSSLNETTTTTTTTTPTTDESPNILLIVADDFGWSDLKPYGGDIIAPNLDKLANESLVFTNFHTMPVCSPSRSVFLTGVDPHNNGMGTMDVILTPNQKGQPGYETYLNDKVTTVAQTLNDSGYHTYTTGKWHLGKNIQNWPINRGFEESFTLLHGGRYYVERLVSCRYL